MPGGGPTWAEGAKMPLLLPSFFATGLELLEPRDSDRIPAGCTTLKLRETGKRLYFMVSRDNESLEDRYDPGTRTHSIELGEVRGSKLTVFVNTEQYGSFAHGIDYHFV